MHRLLQRQLNRAEGSDAVAPKDWESFLTTVDAAYTAADNDLALTQRSLELMSEELNDRNANLQAQILQRQQAEEQLKTSILQLKQKNDQISQLNAMGDLLRSCRRMKSAYQIISDSLQKLFSTQAGLIAIYDTTSSTLNTVAQWGEESLLKKAMPKNDDSTPTPDDKNIQAPDARFTKKHVCINLSNQGQQIGTIHLILKTDPLDENNDTANIERNQLVQATSDHISLALANIALQENLRQQVIHDPLTGLFNRRHMEASLKRETCRAQRTDKPLGIIMIDIDHFKRINDNYGHPVGDSVLAALGAFLGSQVRGDDIACRFGGEEFILILPGADIRNTANRAEQICRDVSNTLKIGTSAPSPKNITVSIGVSCFPENGNTMHDIINKADTALYEAKRAGRNRVVIAS